ncbi:MerR family transcriptional regulator [Streptomyces sp. CB02923]|uniref:MerR family transcriptional regulator n=1 Tax=Streptomyces sp. CB02923 TaxID=1718985 RepID=UPI00093EF321|nr:MerR family transcriptional regulator [Streptomyces sp. CB02923]OKI09784.1 MerR family transcriptional regulator [Streptomyces sp. CB02923]
MRIGDAAAAAGMTARALRYYEEQGLVIARRTPSGHRVYGPEDVRRLRTVRELLDAGLTVGDIRSFAPLLDALPPDGLPRLLFAGDGGRGAAVGGGPECCRTAEEVARRRLADLDARIERLTRLRGRLAQRLGEPARVPGRVAPYGRALRE